MRGCNNNNNNNNNNNSNNNTITFKTFLMEVKLLPFQSSTQNCLHHPFEKAANRAIKNKRN